MPESHRSQARYRNNGTTQKPAPTTTPGWDAKTMSTHSTGDYREEKIQVSAEEYGRVNATPPVGKEKRTPGQPIKEVADAQAAQASRTRGTDNSFGVLDALRVLMGLLVVSAGLSYLSTSGESMTWGYNPWWTRAREWRALIVRLLPPFPFLFSQNTSLPSILSFPTQTTFNRKSETRSPSHGHRTPRLRRH